MHAIIAITLFDQYTDLKKISIKTSYKNIYKIL